MDKTTQGLKTLAEYMGWKEEAPNVYINKPHAKYISNFEYNTSWDALVPVYAKWNAEAANKEINRELYFNTLSLFDFCVETDNIQAAFEAVVELINLINKENGK